MSKEINSVVWQDQKLGELGAEGIMFFVHGSQRQQIGRLIGRDEAIEVAKFLGVPLEDEHKVFPREAFLTPDYYEQPGHQRSRCVLCGYCATEDLSRPQPTVLDIGGRQYQHCVVCDATTRHRIEEVQ